MMQMHFFMKQCLFIFPIVTPKCIFTWHATSIQGLTMDTIDNIESPQGVEGWGVLSNEQTNKRTETKQGDYYQASHKKWFLLNWVISKTSKKKEKKKRKPNDEATGNQTFYNCHRKPASRWESWWWSFTHFALKKNNNNTGLLKFRMKQRGTMITWRYALFTIEACGCVDVPVSSTIFVVQSYKDILTI